MAIEEGWLSVHEADVEICKKAVASAKTQLQVGLSIDVQVSNVLAYKPHLGRGIVVETGTLCTGQFATHRNITLRIVRQTTPHVHQLVGT